MDSVVKLLTFTIEIRSLMSKNRGC